MHSLNQAVQRSIYLDLGLPGSLRSGNGCGRQNRFGMALKGAATKSSSAGMIFGSLHRPFTRPASQHRSALLAGIGV